MAESLRAEILCICLKINIKSVSGRVSEEVGEIPRSPKSDIDNLPFHRKNLMVKTIAGVYWPASQDPRKSSRGTMKRVAFLLLSAAFLSLPVFAVPKPNRVREPVDGVNPLIGTTNPWLRWMIFPGPAMPFGMVKLSPDNRAGRHWRAGYDYKIDTLLGFSHIHSWTMTGLLMMPTTGPLKLVQGPEEGSPESFPVALPPRDRSCFARLLRGNAGRLQNSRRTDHHHARGISALHVSAKPTRRAS